MKTNAQIYMIDIINNGGFAGFAMSPHGQIIPCSEDNCSKCQFEDELLTCDEIRLGWLDQKYKAQLTEFELELLRHLDDEGQIYIEDGRLKEYFNYRAYCASDDEWDEHNIDYIPIKNLEFKGVPREEWVSVCDLI